MKAVLTLATLLLVFAVNAQKKKDTPALHLKNVVVIGQMDEPADRYSVESSMTQLFTDYGLQAKASLNLVKQGADAQVLASDSIGKSLAGQGYDTYLLISVRGYDKRFKASEVNEDMATSLSRGNLFGIFQDGIVSVSFEFKFFRNGQLVHNEIIKCGNAGSRGKVMNKLRKKVGKRILKSWV